MSKLMGSTVSENAYNDFVRTFAKMHLEQTVENYC